MSWDMSIGSEFAGYRITGVLGRGGMSVVFTAQHMALGRTVALKVLSPGLSMDESFRDRFVRESQLAATLEHPNIIPIYDAGEAQDYLYIAMRHIEGGDLGSLIDRDGPLALGQTIFFIEQVASALDEAHSKGLIHRDVKPANILISRPSDRVYLTDFGVVKQTSTSRITATGYFLGTFAYAAPEQIEGKAIDGRTDLYALGCVLHECLSGEPPFGGRTEGSIIHAHLVESPPRLTAKRPDLPVAVDDVIATAMAKSKEDRYATCAEFARVLRAVALGSARTGASMSALAPTPPAETVLARSEARTPEAEPTPLAQPTPTADPSRLPELAPPESAPPPKPPRAPRTITFSGRRLAAIGAALAAVIAGAVVAALLVSGGGSNQPATNGAATTTAATTQTTPAAPVGLAAVVPQPLYKSCRKKAPVLGAAQTSVCKAPAVTAGAYYPTSWELSVYRNSAALRKAYDALRRSHDIGRNFGQCSGIQWGGEGKWAHGPDKPGGRRFCYFEGNVAVIVWTHEKLGQASHIDLLGTGRSGGSDHSNLFNWYRFWHHRIGKCPEPDCQAELP